MLTTSPLFPQATLPPDDVGRELTRFTLVYGAVEQNFMNPVEPDRAIFDGGIRGMLAALDPFSAFFDREQFKLLEEQARGEALGFGSILYVQAGKVVVLQTREGSPSWRAGLGPGDEIVAVNGIWIRDLDLRSLVELLQQARSQAVRLGVIRPGRFVAQDFELKPAEISLPTVDRAFVLSPGIGYIHLSGFEQRTTEEVARAIEQLGGRSLKGLLLDLRDNHGGMLDAAVGVSGLFFKTDTPVLTVRGRAAAEKAYRTPQTPRRCEVPLIVLVNGNTASAAEVVAAALEEHDRALIVGEPTFGKGVVESVAGLSEKTGLALTTAQYFTPSGRSIQRPLPGTALEPSAAAPHSPSRDAPLFHTDNGRPVSAGGGVTPDVQIPSRALDPWATFLNQRGFFSSFASDYLTLHDKVRESFEPDAKVLESFKDFLTRQRIRVPEKEWQADQDYLKLRIKTEVFNFVFGLARGDEVEVRGDPQVQRAAALFSKIPRLLKAPLRKPPSGRAKPPFKPKLAT